MTLTTLAALIPSKLDAELTLLDEGIQDVDPGRIDADLVGLTVIRHERLRRQYQCRTLSGPGCKAGTKHQCPDGLIRPMSTDGFDRSAAELNVTPVQWVAPGRRARLQIEMGRRLPILSWSHHHEVAAPLTRGEAVGRLSLVFGGRFTGELDPG